MQGLKEKLDDPERLRLVHQDPFAWETYTDLEAAGHLNDVPKRPWEEGAQFPCSCRAMRSNAFAFAVHPNLFLACQLPNTRYGEQLLYQFLATSPAKMWLYRYGRFASGYLGPQTFLSAS